MGVLNGKSKDSEDTNSKGETSYDNALGRSSMV